MLEVMVVLAMMATLLVAATASWRGPVAKVQQAEARSTLVRTAFFLERWYADHRGFTDEGIRWPPLPEDGTKHYRLVFEAQPGNVEPGKFRLYAYPRPGLAADPASWLVLDESAVVRLCQKINGRKQCQ
ncbi:hypothetical protein GCM10011289_20210 [Paludibacterium paludis]|uniref:Uncharacterized protein n=1 Tax=Paludibacterium paludis TaxID=1225769 RepID=A0A918P3G9_9NEIS|nr:hypothetical protein GCM10011289_20210 [Paludibacterium paludis]